MVLLVNVIVMSVSIQRDRKSETWFGQYFEGKCETVDLYNKWVHLAINIISTILLGSSEYCAHIIVAPTRRDIDKVHERGDWYDVGVHSFRNVIRMNIRRKVVWMILMISSILLHLV